MSKAIYSDLDLQGNALTDATLETAAVATAGALMTTDLLDEDNMASDSASKTSSQQALKAYVDSQTSASAAGLDVKDSVKIATTANITLSGEQTIDGVLSSTDRILVKNQTTGSENGIYVTAAGAWSRSTDADEDAEVTTGLFCLVTDGTVNGSTGWVLQTANPITVDTTSLSFNQFSFKQLTDAQIKTQYEANSDTNEFSDAEQTKLGAIEASADVTDATNVNTAGAVMNTDTTTASMSFVKDEDDMSSDSATHLSSQQAIKAFVEGRRFTATIVGDASTTAFTITHNLGYKLVNVVVADDASPFTAIGVVVEYDDTNNVGITITPAPGVGEDYDVAISV